MTEDIHVSRRYCALCVDHPTAGERIIDLEEDGFPPQTVPDCEKNCVFCKAEPNPLLCIHTRCLRLLMASYEPSDKPSLKDIRKFALATEELYPKSYPERGNPGTVLEGLASRYTSWIIPESFKEDFFGKLPPEIRRRISEFVGSCWYLTILGETRRLIDYGRQNKEPQEDELDLTKDIWMSRIICRDHSYVAQLSNTPLKAAEGADVFQVQLPRNIHRVIISQDHIGVRGIQFLNRDATPTEDQSPWYEIFNVQNSHPKLGVYRHCLLMQRIALVNGQYSGTESLTWTSPFAPALHELVQTPFNRGGTIASPMYIGFIFHSMIRNRSREPGSGAGLLPRGRHVTFGAQAPDHYLANRRYHPMLWDVDGPVSGIYHDGMDPGSSYVTVCGVTCHSPRNGQTPVLVPIRDISEFPGGNRNKLFELWFMTKATLRGLVKVQVCRDRMRSHHPCLGMLMFYDDGHVESSGQIRWDYGLGEDICSPIIVVKGVNDGREYIKDIRSAKDKVESTVHPGDQQVLPAEGILAWWFCEVEDRLAIYGD
ncbi:hypothetical protein AnigIFM56816_005662 [Aspergillus niger]|nr:hypothetical protein AnigIFM56816_005662 [Aspergillus niger]